MKKSESMSWPWRIVMGIIIVVALMSAWMVWQTPGSVAKQAVELGKPQGTTLVWKGLDAASAAAPSSIVLPGQTVPTDHSQGSALDSTTYPDFRSDKQGMLVLDDLTKDGLERIIALNERGTAQAKVGELSKHLPPGAQRQAEDLFFRYQQYSAALAQAFAPGDQPSGDDAALQQLDALHALRVEHFGADTAKALFAGDEETARQLIILTRSQDSPDLSHDQKVELAQQAYDRMKAAAKPPR